MKTSPVVIFHGWTSLPETEQKWQPFVQLFTAAGFETHFVPIPGLTQPLEESWTLDQYVSWAHKIVQSYQSAVVIGHSFGGQIALKLAHDHPEQVRSLVLIDSSGVPDNRWQKRLKRAVFWVLAKIGKQLPLPSSARKLLYVLAGERDYFQANKQQQQTMRRVIREDLRQLASELKTPTLLVWGEADQTTPLWMGQQLAARIPNSQLNTIAGARHSPQYTHAKQTAQGIIDWLNQ